jgi:hypothetical protein
LAGAVLGSKFGQKSDDAPTQAPPGGFAPTQAAPGAVSPAAGVTLGGSQLGGLPGEGVGGGGVAGQPAQQLAAAGRQSGIAATSAVNPFLPKQNQFLNGLPTVSLGQFTNSLGRV